MLDLITFLTFFLVFVSGLVFACRVHVRVTVLPGSRRKELRLGNVTLGRGRGSEPKCNLLVHETVLTFRCVKQFVDLNISKPQARDCTNYRTCTQ